jgi:hypothetical protein
MLQDSRFLGETDPADGLATLIAGAGAADALSRP